jgi:hypothetical protein
VTFNYTGADVSYTINPGTYRITVYGAQGGSTEPCGIGCVGGLGAEASAVYKVGQTLDLRIGVGGKPQDNQFAGGGGASFVDFVVGDPGLTVLLLVGGGGGGAFQDIATTPVDLNGGNGLTTPTNPNANGSAPGGGGGGGYFTDGQSNPTGGGGGMSLATGGAGAQAQPNRSTPGGFGGGGGGGQGKDVNRGGGGGGGFNGGDGGFEVIASDGHVVETSESQGGTSYVNNNPDGCGPDGGPACFVGGLVLAVGAEVNGQGLGNGTVIIESITGSPVPEPSTWAMMAIGFAGLGIVGWRGSRRTAAHAR